MAVNKVASLALVILFGTFLLISEVEYVDAAVCPRNCDPKIRYGRCPKSGNKKFNIGCTNCCSGLAGCNYFSANGTFICEGQTEPKVETIETSVESMVESNKVCTRNCNPTIRYGRCPKSGNKKFNVGCTNCCSGLAGCNYFSANGTFICEGETETKVETIETSVKSMVESTKACPRNCNPTIRYGRCPKSGNKKFNVGCTNCCSGLAGCNYFSANGTFVCEGQTESKVETIETTREETMGESNRVCPFNCNPRIAYSICPGNKRSSGRLCINCCAGRKGCNYFSADGTFVCEGESEVESKVEVKPCPRNCDSRVAYMTCPDLGLAKLSQVCVNCCTAGKGCKLYGYDGSELCTGGEIQTY